MTLGGSNSDSVSGDQLRGFIERVERLDEELATINDAKKEVFAEAKGNGFDVKALKIVLKERRQDVAERMELEAIVDLYRAALGMSAIPYFDREDWTGTPVATRAPAREIEHHSDAPTTKGIPRPTGGASDTGSSSADNPGDAAAPTNSAIAADPAEEAASPQQASSADTNPVGNHHALHGAGTDETRGVDEGGAPASLVAPTAADNARALRPYCLHADDLSKCAGQGRKHCWECQKAHADEVGDAA